MTSRLDVLAISPSTSPAAQPTASLHRVPWGGFPDFTGTISWLPLLALLPELLRSPSLPGTIAWPLFALWGQTTPQSLDDFARGTRAALSTKDMTRPPRFLGDPCVHAPLLDPGGPPLPRLAGNE